MGLFSRRRTARTAPAADAPSPREAQQQTVEHLREFARSRVGVEAYLEPQTNVTQTTIMLIASDGEWTRRRVPDARAAGDLARSLEMPLYDVQRTGYPQRMRDWNSRQRIERERAATERAARRAADPS
ncbi:MAG TPA: oxidoreductase [Cellulomonas sp.]